MPYRAGLVFGSVIGYSLIAAVLQALGTMRRAGYNSQDGIRSRAALDILGSGGVNVDLQDTLASRSR